MSPLKRRATYSKRPRPQAFVCLIPTISRGPRTNEPELRDASCYVRVMPERGRSWGLGGMAQAGVALLRGGLLLATFSFACPAFAAEAHPADSGGAERKRSWYGWQILVADGVATGLFVTAAATDSRPVFTTGIVSYALVGPTVHVLHDRAWPDAGSLGLRIALPGLFGLIGYGTVSCRSDYADEAEGAACTDKRRTRGSLGLVAGAAIATAVDASLIAFERGPVGSPKIKRE